MSEVRATVTRGVSEAISYAVAHGIVVGTSTAAPMGTNLCHAPFTLRPSRVDPEAYHHALRITPTLNRLIRAISTDLDYMRAVLAETSLADAHFTGRLLDIATRLAAEPPRHALHLSVCRYDYFINKSRLSMVEMNCIAASFAALGTETSRMHRYLAAHPTAPSSPKIDLADLPHNDALAGIASGLAHGHHSFVEAHKSLFANNDKNSHRCVCLMIVQPGERNAYDQYGLQASLWRTHTINMVRASLARVSATAEVDADGLLSLCPEESDERVIVSVAYFRAGYTPDDYPTEKEWAGREALERSAALSVPTVAVQLVGTKKIQQVLTVPGELERFLGNTDDIEAIKAVRDTFVTQLSLATVDDGDAHAKLAIDSPDDYVLKPQREGGGNNLYGQDLKQALEGMTAEERQGFILMQRIRPDVVDNVIVRNGQHGCAAVVSELGVYGVIAGDGSDEKLNVATGTLLRSKAAHHDDGGVAAGVAVLDSPLLC